MDTIEGAMRLAGIIADGETITGKEATDALFALNQMIEAWALDDLLLYTLTQQVFTWPANTAQRTVGASGTLTGSRPLEVSSATFFRDTTNDIRYPMRIVGEKEFFSVGFTNVTSVFPEIMYVNYAYPNAELNIFPKLTTSKELNLFSRQELTQPATLTTVLAFPPGYAQSFRYNLAVLLGPEFGVSVSNEVIRVAIDTKDKIRKLNKPDNELDMPITGNGRYNVYSDRFR
jgi:hypothetical protein